MWRSDRGRANRAYVKRRRTPHAVVSKATSARRGTRGGIPPEGMRRTRGRRVEDPRPACGGSEAGNRQLKGKTTEALALERQESPKSFHLHRTTPDTAGLPNGNAQQPARESGAPPTWIRRAAHKRRKTRSKGTWVIAETRGYWGRGSPRVTNARRPVRDAPEPDARDLTSHAMRWRADILDTPRCQQRRKHAQQGFPSDPLHWNAEDSSTPERGLATTKAFRPPRGHARRRAGTTAMRNTRARDNGATANLDTTRCQQRRKMRIKCTRETDGKRGAWLRHAPPREGAAIHA